MYIPCIADTKTKTKFELGHGVPLMQKSRQEYKLIYKIRVIRPRTYPRLENSLHTARQWLSESPRTPLSGLSVPGVQRKGDSSGINRIP
ncbi:hypothetical protein VTK26DRAFT_2318 [Humicola hyalothermophila]